MSILKCPIWGISFHERMHSPYRELTMRYGMKKQESFELIEGNGLVMISAPHAVEHVREGKVRYPEPQTAFLAKALHERLDCPVIYKTANAGDDANYDVECPYKQAITEFVRSHQVRFLLDLHQMAGFRPIQICIGTGRYTNMQDEGLVEQIVKIFEQKGITPVNIDQPFAASYPYTVSAYVHRECKLPCLQIEINSNLLMDGQPVYAGEQVLEALTEIVGLIGKEA